MRSAVWMLVSVLGVTAAAYGKEPKVYQSGDVLQMESVPCGPREKAAANICEEYVVQTERVTYRVRSKDAKQSAGLPVGERTLFRLEKGKFLVRAEVSAGNGKEKEKEAEYFMESIMPRSESTADASPVRLNHLQ